MITRIALVVAIIAAVIFVVATDTGKTRTDKGDDTGGWTIVERR